MKKIWTGVLLLSALLCVWFSGCGHRKGEIKEAEGEMGYTKISQKEAKELMDSGEEIVILDVRTEEEYAMGHIPRAICISHESIDESVEQKLPDKEMKILVYCRSGHRSAIAAEKLVELGYRKVLDFGGIMSWSYEVVKD